MKILKTFLFTISLSFLSFGFVTLKGFCQAVPELVPDSTGLSVIEGGGMPYYYSMNGFNELWFMSPEFNQSINDYGSAVDNYMEQNYGYDVEHFYNLGVNGSVFVDSGALDVATANWLANKMTQGTLTALDIANQGYSVFSHRVQQWGQNAKEWFIGKYDDVTGKISNVQDNIVTKITSEGISNYLSMYNSQLQSGVINNQSSGNAFKSKNFQLNFWYHGSTSVFCRVNINFDVDIVFYNGGQANNYNTTKLFCIVPESYCNLSGNYYDFVCNGVYVYGSQTIPVTKLRFTNSSILNVNGVNYIYGPVNLYSNSSLIGDIECRIPMGDYTQAVQLLSSVGSITNVYQFNPNFDISSLLNQLVGKYVDNNIMKQIVEKIGSAPITIQTVDNNQLPLIEIDPSLKEDIEGLIDIAIANSTRYEQLLEPLEESEPEPEPDPVPNNQGTQVPEDFPTTIFSPINDSVGSVFDFISIFEPLFYIFSFSAGLLGLWLMIPFVILFLIFFRLLK